MFNNVFAASYKYYSKFKTEAPRFSAVCVVTMTQILFIFLVLILTKRIFDLDIMGMLSTKYMFIPILILWLIMVYNHYSEDKVKEIVHAFEEKTPGERKVWGIATIASLILPIVFIAVLLTK